MIDSHLQALGFRLSGWGILFTGVCIEGWLGKENIISGVLLKFLGGGVLALLLQCV